MLLMTVYVINGQNLFRDDMSAYTINQQLSGQGTWTNNSSNPGGLGVAITGDGGSNAKVLASGVVYPGYGTSANGMEIKPNGDGCGTSFTEVTNGDLYVAFVLNLSAAQVNNNSDFFRVMSGGNFNTTFRLYAINAGFSFFLSTAKGANGNPLAQSTLSYDYNQNHLVVVKYSQLPGAGDDIVSVYIDPVFSNGEPAVASATTNTGADQAGNIDRMAYRQNWTNGMPTGKAGLVSVARTWADLSFIPLATNAFNINETVIDSENAKNGILKIASKAYSGAASLQIYSIEGTLVETQTINISASGERININPLQSSVYILKIVTDKNDVITKKIIVK